MFSTACKPAVLVNAGHRTKTRLVRAGFPVLLDVLTTPEVMSTWQQKASDMAH